MKMKTMAFWFGTIMVMLTFFGPIIWMYLTSIKTNADIYNLDIAKLFVFSPTLANYQQLFFETEFLSSLWNTLIIAVASTVLVMAVALPAAYSFSRFNTGYGHLLFITISTRMFPAIVAALPFFFGFKALGILDTTFGMTMLYYWFNLSFAVFLLYGFFREIPVELEQAAMIDGHTQLTILRKIIFPLIKPGAAITAVFCLIFAWNEFLYAFLFTGTNTRTVTIVVGSFRNPTGVNWGTMAACVCMAILPTLLAAWFMQRYIIRGLTFGAVKG